MVFWHVCAYGGQEHRPMAERLSTKKAAQYANEVYKSKNMI